MPELVRLYIVNVAIGFCLAVLFTALLLILDVAHLRHLVLNTAGGWLAVLMLVVFNTIVFAGVQFGIAVMSLADKPTGPKGGRRIRVFDLPRQLIPVRVGARSAPRR
ncbi:hypothetical protein GI374_12795 [Paracoccus sp. S-4012]|uniref:hypothetical protein n=1 Tax=Paracoccus sp. S-4012 TaxID=2665648 RepID=UPI0012AFDA3C|nr:hypothetical protein [Paracoccus sp. S-4012]MRX51306.1 hypothetical protein [Paracoccus sp. S-4012]